MWTASPQGHGQIQHMFDSETLWALSCQRETPLLMFKLYLVPYLTPQCHLTERILQGAVIYLESSHAHGGIVRELGDGRKNGGHGRCGGGYLNPAVEIDQAHLAEGLGQSYPNMDHGVRYTGHRAHLGLIRLDKPRTSCRLMWAASLPFIVCYARSSIPMLT